MTEPFEIQPAPARALSFEQIAALHDVSFGIDHPLAIVLILATLTPCSANALTAARIEHIDWSNLTFMASSPLGFSQRVQMSSSAAMIALTHCGDRRRGFLIEDANGSPVTIDADADEYLGELVKHATGGEIASDWTLRSVREGVFDCMIDGPVPYPIAVALAGLAAPNLPSLLEPCPFAQLVVHAEWWADRLARHSHRIALRPHPASSAAAVRRRLTHRAARRAWR